MYYLYSLLTAPGVMVHELGHAFFCWLAGVKIHKIKLFQWNKKIAGYVTHDEPRYFFQSLLISFGPLIINSLLALIFFAKITRHFGAWFVSLKTGQDLSLLWLWLGITVSLHAIPSTGDARSLVQLVNSRVLRNPFLVAGYPFVLALYILNWLRRLRIDFIYVIILFWLGSIFLKK